MPGAWKLPYKAIEFWSVINDHNEIMKLHCEWYDMLRMHVCILSLSPPVPISLLSFSLSLSLSLSSITLAYV